MPVIGRRSQPALAVAGASVWHLGLQGGLSRTVLVPVARASHECPGCQGASVLAWTHVCHSAQAESDDAVCAFQGPG